MRKLIFIFVLLLNAAYAQKPQLELGIGLGSIYFPDYMGSKSTQSYTLPFPYLVYRSKWLNIDKEGIRSTLFDLKNLMLDISIGGSLPANSKHSKAREGMPNLDLTFEVGPKITYKFYQHGLAHLYFELPVRAIFSTDFKNISHQGYLATPQIKYALEYKHFEFRLRSGVMIASKRYHEYFYEVTPQYATATRPVYETQSGLSGYRNRISCEYTKGNWHAGAFFSYYDLSDSVFKNSPLLETKEAFYSGFAIAYIFYKKYP